MTLHGKQTHTQKRNAKTTAHSSQKLSHTHVHAKTNEKNDQEFRRHTHTLIDEPLYQRSVLAIHTHTCVWANCLGNQFEWRRRVASQRPSLCWGRKQWKLYTLTHTNTLKDALIKHGSKNWRKRNETKGNIHSIRTVVVH